MQSLAIFLANVKHNNRYENKIRVVIIGLIFVVIFSASFGFVYSQIEPIPTWIKGVAGFWAEDKITDKEFLEALEFLIESGIIKVSDPRVLELENEIILLENEIMSLTNKIIGVEKVEPEPISKVGDRWITTDKEKYSLGDTVYVSGITTLEQPKKLANG